MEVFFSFISLILLSAGLGIDNGLLIEFSLKGLRLEPRKHLLWRSVALVFAALLRIGFLFSLSRFTFLEKTLPEYAWLPNRWFPTEHAAPLTWMSLVLFLGGLIILAMALWEYYHKLRGELRGHESGTSTVPSGRLRIVVVVA